MSSAPLSERSASDIPASHGERDSWRVRRILVPNLLQSVSLARHHMCGDISPRPHQKDVYRAGAAISDHPKNE
jgi:hypothetical protein